TGRWGRGGRMTKPMAAAAPPGRGASHRSPLATRATRHRSLPCVADLGGRIPRSGRGVRRRGRSTIPAPDPIGNGNRVVKEKSAERLFGEFVMIDVIVNLAYGRRRMVALGWGHV